MRLANVETGHTPEAKEALAQIEATVGHLDGIDLLTAYRPELFGDRLRLHRPGHGGLGGSGPGPHHPGRSSSFTHRRLARSGHFLSVYRGFADCLP